MKMIAISVSEEYLESLCEWMQEWVKKEDSYTVPQFLEEKGIGYPYLRYFCHISDQVNNTFEIMKYILHNRWLKKALEENTLSPHKEKLLRKYLRLYDTHALFTEKEFKQEISDHSYPNHPSYIENYGRSELKRPYKEIYAKNTNKRRNRSQTQ